MFLLLPSRHFVCCFFSFSFAHIAPFFDFFITLSACMPWLLIFSCAVTLLRIFSWRICRSWSLNKHRILTLPVLPLLSVVRALWLVLHFSPCISFCFIIPLSLFVCLGRHEHHLMICDILCCGRICLLQLRNRSFPSLSTAAPFCMCCRISSQDD